MREMKCKVVNVGAKLRLNEDIWFDATCLCADDHAAGRKRGELAESSKSVL